jgi:hypothetical protein
MKFLMTQCGVKEEELTARLVCFGANEVSTFKWGHFGFVTRPSYAKIMASMKNNVKKLLVNLLQNCKVQGQLPAKNLMDAFGIVYPQH